LVARSKKFEELRLACVLDGVEFEICDGFRSVLAHLKDLRDKSIVGGREVYKYIYISYWGLS
jgi:hypothetical protein